jgi:hypothetical protein
MTRCRGCARDESAKLDGCERGCAMSAFEYSSARKSRVGGTQREPRLWGTLQAGAFDRGSAQDLKLLGQSIAGDGDGIDACVGEEAGKLGLIARRLAAQTDPSSLAMGALDRTSRPCPPRGSPFVAISASTRRPSSSVRQNGIITLTFTSPITSRTRRSASHSRAKPSR